MNTLGINQQMFDNSNRRFSKQCLDFSERRYHVGGHLGKELLTAMIENDWINPIPDAREKVITSMGKSYFEGGLGIVL